MFVYAISWSPAIRLFLCLPEINLVKSMRIRRSKRPIMTIVRYGFIHHANGSSTCFGGYSASTFGRANSVYNYSTSKILVRYGLTTRFDAYSHRCPVNSRRT